MGPNISNSTMNETEMVKDGRTRKAHPVWGSLMLSIPFLPMLVAPLALVFLPAKDGRKSWFCGILVLFLICAAPFTLITTPIYIVGVIVGGCVRFFRKKIGKKS